MSVITKDGIEVKAGQVWRDLDKRSNGRTVTIEAVLIGNEHVRAKGVRRVELAVRRMCKPHWELVQK